MSDTPLFRIEHKETLERRFAEKKKRLSATVEIRSDRLTIGVRSDAGLVLNDPVAAAHHCEIIGSGGTFRLREGRNGSGTYLNGIQLEGEEAIGPGDRFSLGVTTIELVESEHPNTLTLHVREGAFFYAAKKRGEFESDADEWVRSEVTFGRMPVLRGLNALAIVLALGAAFWLWLSPEGKAALQPGCLSEAHAALFSESPPTDAHLMDAVAIASAQGCAACHESYGAPTMAKCAVCHGDIVDSAIAGQAHPFAAGAALECIGCHREHHGSEPPPGALHPVDISQDCSECHGTDYQDEASLREGLASAVGKHDLAPTNSATVARRVSQGFEAFDHGSHHMVDDCSACHKSGDQGSGSDFAGVTFRTCNGCHGASPAEGLPTAWIPREELRFDLDWHGSGEGGANCRSCHVDVYAAPLVRTSQVPAATAFFTLESRSHTEQFHGGDSPGDCATCHKAGDLRGPRRTLEGRPFRHGQHLSNLWPDDDQGLALANAQCAECHVDMSTSDHLVAAPDAYVGPPVASCASCHVDAGTSLVTSPGVVQDVAPGTLLPAFPHDVHASVEGGCMACHGFDVESPGLVQTPADVVSCVRCHVEVEAGQPVAHASIGGGQGCSTCHAPRGESSPDGSSGSKGAMSSVFYGPSSNPPTASNFPHALEAHQGPACTDCHGTPSEGKDIHSPPESATSCRECHAARRFHWR